MFSSNRRRFLGQAAAAGIACSTDTRFRQVFAGTAPNRESRRGRARLYRLSANRRAFGSQSVWILS